LSQADLSTKLPFRGDRQARIVALHHERSAVERLTGSVYESVLAQSPHIRAGNFTAIGVDDLFVLFDLYDEAFFAGQLGQMIREDRAELGFRLSSRMTRAGGTTSLTRERRPFPGRPPRTAYEITVSTVLLFGTFREVDRPVTVGGLVCRDRLEALQRIFEHELLHLAEFLALGRSSCAEANFRSLSWRIFAHEGVRHDLVSPREVAAETFDIRVGNRVAFDHEGVLRVGIVNRITKRATVLVEDARGRPYSDGKTYATYYVPVGWLRKAAEPA
jgi:hypothetical protein